jgi:hypothetical protein
MIARITFIIFFIAAFLMPLWPILLIIGMLYIIAWIIPSGGNKK